MLTDEQLIERLRGGLAALRLRADLIDRVREQAATDQRGDRDPRRRPRIAGRRRVRAPVGVLALGATGALSLGIAMGALVLVHHPGTTSATALRGRDLPASVSAAQVAAPLTLRALPVARYCNAAASGYPQLVPCRRGLKPLAHAGREPFSARSERLVQLTFIARRAAGVDSWYAFELTAPRACLGDSQSGPTNSPVRAGARLRFDFLLPPNCRGAISADVAYWAIAPHADIERTVLVGSRTLRGRTRSNWRLDG